MNTVFAYTGGAMAAPGAPATVFVHGAGMDHTVWRHLARYLAHHGRRILAPDLPGHGRSSGPPLTSVEAAADWLADFTAAAGAERFSLVGHSLGGLVALHLAASHPDRIDRLVLIATAMHMPVHPQLLESARAGESRAVELIVGWSFGPRGRRGGRSDPGTSAAVVVRRVLQRGLAASLGPDLAASDQYQTGASSAALITVPTMVLVGSEDRMVLAKAAAQLAGAIAGAELAVIEGAGHMMTIEDPEAVQDVVVGFLAAR